MMGKLARLNAAKGIKRTEWMVAIFNDFSYEMKEEVDGKMVDRRVENWFYSPFGTMGRHVLSFRSMDEVKEWVKEFLSGLDGDPKSKNTFMELDLHAVELKYVPSKQKKYDNVWAKDKVLQDVKLDLKSLVSAQIK